MVVCEVVCVVVVVPWLCIVVCHVCVENVWGYMSYKIVMCGSMCGCVCSCVCGKLCMVVCVVVCAVVCVGSNVSVVICALCVWLYVWVCVIVHRVVVVVCVVGREVVCVTFYSHMPLTCVLNSMQHSVLDHNIRDALVYFSFRSEKSQVLPFPNLSKSKITKF